MNERKLIIEFKNDFEVVSLWHQLNIAASKEYVEKYGLYENGSVKVNHKFLRDLFVKVDNLMARIQIKERKGKV